MSTIECPPQSKCGYCGWILFGTQFHQHECFASFNEDVHVIVVDDNGIITMNTLNTDSSQEETVEPATQDEILIDAVAARKPLWDHTIDVSERTKLKKDALWNQVCNVMGGLKTPKEVKKRWQYLRDCYGKAKTKMQTYVPSGSGAEADHPSRSTFRYYERMKFLQSALDPQDTVDSLPNIAHASNSQSDDAESQRGGSNSTIDQDCRSPINRSSSTNVRNRTSSSSSSGTSEKSKKRSADTSELEAEFLQYLKEAQPTRDAVDGFLEQLGDILRRLPYIQRRNFQLRILTQAIEEEDKIMNS